ncbi:2-oxo-4-hydroxy-4-carboxy-5-ureidoimidazoline decarboxylase [Stigmatopora nigra]
MPHTCCAVGCSNRFTPETRGRGITFHRFPKDPGVRKKWEKMVRRKGFTASSSTMLCSEHFRAENFDRTGQTVRLREGTIPLSVFKPSQEKFTLKPSDARTSRTSMKARETPPPGAPRPTIAPLILPEPPPLPEPTIDHAYASTPDDLRVKLSEALVRVESLEREKRNAKDRERRVRQTVSCLLEDLELKKIMNEELKERLDIYSDLPVHLLSKHSHEYTKEQKDFAMTLHDYGPKAYNYLRECLHINLPHPHTLQRWINSGESKPDLMMLDTPSQDEDDANCCGRQRTIQKTMNLSQVNALPYEDFVNVFGNVVERCPVAAAAIWSKLPFADVDAFQAAICDFVDSLPDSGKEGILRCHADRVGRDLESGRQVEGEPDPLISDESCTMFCLNEEYKERFSFPFIICVRADDKAAIYQEMRNRITNDCATERERGIEEVKKMCRLRLRDMVLNDEPS